MLPPIERTARYDFDFLKESNMIVRHACEMTKNPIGHVMGVWYDDTCNLWCVVFVPSANTPKYCMSREQLLAHITPTTFYKLDRSAGDHDGCRNQIPAVGA